MRVLARFLALVFAALAPVSAFAFGAGQLAAVRSGGTPSWVLPGASADCALTSAKCWIAGAGTQSLPSNLLVSNSGGTAQWADGHWSTFAANTLRQTDQGVLIEEARTNLFLNSTAPATQTITVVNGSTYTVSVYGTASVVLSGATTGTVTQGNPKTFTAGSTSLVCTVSGAGGTFQNVQVELGAFATSPIPTSGTAVARAADVITAQGALANAIKASHAARFESGLGEGIVTNARLLNPTSGGQLIGYSATGTVSIANGSGTATAILGSDSYSGFVESAFGYDATSFTAIANGGTQASSANPFGTMGGTIYFGSQAGTGRALNGYLRRITFGSKKGQFDASTTVVLGWNIIVDAGQSNACEVGLGTWTDTSAANDFRIYQMGRGGADDLKIIPATRPLDYWTPGTGHGGGLSRARRYIAQGYLPLGYKLLIIPAAKGGTSILQWMDVTDTLYDDMSMRTRLALSTLPNASVKMLVWRQMEADITYASAPADNPNHVLMPDAATYHSYELALIDRFRSDFGMVPIIRGLPTDAWKSGDSTKNSFLAVTANTPNERPLYIITDSTGLGTNFDVTGTSGDEIHFNAAAQETMAQRDIQSSYRALVGR